MHQLLRRSLLPIFVLILAPASAPAARVDQPVMRQVRALTNQAHDLLKYHTTADKGGHRIIALKLLRNAVAEINAGMEYDRTHTGPNEGRRPR